MDTICKELKIKFFRVNDIFGSLSLHFFVNVGSAFEFLLMWSLYFHFFVNVVLHEYVSIP